MTSDGHEDHHATSAPADPPPSMFRYRPPPDPPAPYGYPPPTDPAPATHSRRDPVPPAPDRVRGTASVPVGRPAQPAGAAPASPAPTGPPAAPGQPAPAQPAPGAPTPGQPTPGAPVPAGSARPQPPGPARGTAAVAAVPTANRARPESGEPGSFTPQPRVYQTAAGLPQQVSPPAPPLPVRTPTAPAGLTEPPSPATHPVPGSAAGYPAHPTHPAAEPPPPPGRLPRPRQPALPIYSDLLGPAPAPTPNPSAPAPTPNPAGPATWPAGWAQAQADLGPGGPDYRDHRRPDYGGGPAQPYDQPTAAAVPPPATPPTGYLPQQRDDADQSPTPPAGPGATALPAPDGGQPDRPGLPVGVIVGLVLIGATVLVLGALSIPFLLDRLNSTGTAAYAVGDCVVQDGQAARPVDCGAPDAYQIVARVDSQDQCDDPTQPAIEVEGPPVRFFCLVPAAGSAE